MPVLVKERFVHMLVLMFFGKMQIHARRHQRGGGDHGPCDGLAEQRNRDRSADKGGGRKIRPGPGRTEVTQPQYEERKADTITEETDDRVRGGSAKVAKCAFWKVAKGGQLGFVGRRSSLANSFNTSNRSVQFYPPLFVNLLLFVDKETAEHIQYNGKTLHETKKIVALLFRIARELKIFSRRPLDAMLVTKLPRSVGETVYIGMAREPAA
jgi:hypothetical protein